MDHQKWRPTNLKQTKWEIKFDLILLSERSVSLHCLWNGSLEGLFGNKKKKKGNLGLDHLKLDNIVKGFAENVSFFSQLKKLVHHG